VGDLVRRVRGYLSGRGVVAAVPVSAAVVGVVTGLVFGLRELAPAPSLGALYILAVLPVAVVYGRGYAALVALASMLLFNYLFLPPTLTFTLSGGENWLVLAVYVITGLLVSDLAARARRRAREAEQRERESAFLAELSSVLLSGVEVASELPRVADATSRLLNLPAARIELGPPATSGSSENPIELAAGRRLVGTLYLPEGSEPNLSARLRFLPALGSVLGIALDRERLAREALETESLRRSDLLKTALLRTVSHDLRSPLTAIRASLEGLASSELALDAGQREALLRSALAESERLDRTVRNLLDLSRLQAGAARPDLKLRTIDGLLHQALNHLPAAAPRLALSIPADLPLVNVDPTQVEHALVNLLENAFKFSPPGSTVEVRVECSGTEVQVRILDEGPGIPVVELDRIFEPFRRGSTFGAPRGAGLGLAIVRGFLEANGGRVTAEPRGGGGACFVVSLPSALDRPVAAER
jgi:two-component system sensor histidine kinase KdpD